LHSKDNKLNKALQTVVLQSLKRAEYSTEELGHFGLQLQRYSHFTSPIRRYPDLMTHRMIKNILNNSLNTTNKDNIEEICIDMSDLERVAERSSRQVTQQMICFFLKKYIGQEVSAIVTGVAEFGLFAEIQDFYVSGLIHVSDLSGDRYFLDKESNTLRGRKTGKSYRLGQSMLVTIANVLPEERKITLVPKSNKK
jgi:ribonuclease R